MGTKQYFQHFSRQQRQQFQYFLKTLEPSSRSIELIRQRIEYIEIYTAQGVYLVSDKDYALIDRVRNRLRILVYGRPKKRPTQALLRATRKRFYDFLDTDEPSVELMCRIITLYDSVMFDQEVGGYSFVPTDHAILRNVHKRILQAWKSTLTAS